MADKSKPTEVQPSRAQTATNMIWRKETLGYNAPPEFYKVFGKRAMTFDQIRAAAQAWQRWLEAPMGIDCTKLFERLERTMLASTTETASGEPTDAA